MRIGYVLKKFPRISETFILSEILELTRQGAEVTVFSLNKPDDGLFHQRLAELKTPVVYLPSRKSAAMLDHLRDSLPMLAAGKERVFAQLEQLLLEGRPDTWSILRWGLDVAIEARRRGVEHLHAHFATIATYVARAAQAFGETPYSFTCHAKDIYRVGVTRARFSALASPAKFVVTVCDANREYVLEHLAPGADVRRLYNGVDLQIFHPEHRQPDVRPLVLGVGRLVEKKGFPHLIDAVHALRSRGIDLQCLIVGEGDQREVLEKQIAASGTDTVRLLGLKTSEETRELLARATVVALPCVIGEDGNRDALPTVLLEAMAGGLPVVSTPVVGVAEVLDGGRVGSLVPIGDTAALTDALATLLGDDSLRAERAICGRERAEELFDLARNVTTLRGWFEGGGA